MPAGIGRRSVVLVAICAKCGAEQPPRFRFCGACGAPLAAEPEQEMRKLVTVFFCDLADSTALGERLDPEFIRHVQQLYFDAIEELIVAHGGLVEKFVGDAVMAVFGLPSAHEDDALRAVRAAAAIRERLPELHTDSGLELAYRTGINSGEVVTGGGRTLATGDAVNVAARLEQAAEPGEILLGAETVRLLGSSVEAELLVPLQLRGKAEPVEAYRFRALAGEEKKVSSFFVGRERELSVLADALQRVSEEHELHLFTLMGPAGIGKSRLAAEFTRSLQEQTTVVRGRCLSYGQAITYWPLIEALRALGGRAEDALDQLVAGGATSPQQLAWSVQQALEQVAEERPLVVLLEDLHWAESALLDLLDLVSDLSRNHPIMLLCLARPELLEQRPHWGGGKLNATSLLLEPLTDTDCRSLLTRLQCPSGAEPRVLELAAGNPLFLEELSAFVVEGGGEDELPPRIQALLQARLDLLPDEEQQLLGTAALEGIVFHRGTLEALLSKERRDDLPRQLATLTRKLLIRPAEPALEGEEGFEFQHQLIRDIAYGGLPKSERARLHERCADWLAQHAGSRAELEDIVAYHLEQAVLTRRELDPAGPDLERRAVEALAAAAGRARLRVDLRAAADLWRRALELLPEDDARVPRLEVELGFVLAPLGVPDEARQRLSHAERSTDDPALAAAARVARLWIRLHYGPEWAPAEIRAACREAIPLLEERGDNRTLARAWDTLGLVELTELQIEAASDAWNEAAAHARLAGDRAQEVLSLAQRIHYLSTYRLPHRAAIEELSHLVRRFPGEPPLSACLLLERSQDAYEEGDLDLARSAGREAVAVARRAGYTLLAGGWIAMRAAGELLCGNVEEAERLTLAAIDELQQHRERGHLAWVKTILAEIRNAQGNYREALELAHEAVVVGGPHDRGSVIPAIAARAHANAGLGEIEEAKAAALRAVAIAESSDSLEDQARAHHTLGAVLMLTQELPAAQAAAKEAERLWAALDRKQHLRRATALVEQIERISAAPVDQRLSRSAGPRSIA